MLHITNGESVVIGFRAGAIPGVYLSWDDPLHDGPVPETASLEALSDVRAQALANFGWGSHDTIRQRFSERDRALEGFRAQDETVLWFEHDLYDQLQLIQLLNWFSHQDLTGTRVSLIQAGEFLGELDGERLAALLPTRVAVTDRQLALGREAWEAFCAFDPSALVALAGRSDPAMPFLPAALQRLLEEYPSTTNGLSRTEQQLLVSAALGARTRHALYRQSQSFESCAWGDASVFLRLDGLAGGPHPVLDPVGTGTEDEFEINPFGERLLSSEDDWLRLSGGSARWIGGVRLDGTAPWRWNGRALVGGLGAGGEGRGWGRRQGLGAGG